MGAYSLLNPLSNLINLSSLNLNLINSLLTKHSEHLFIHYFKLLKSLILIVWLNMYLRHIFLLFKHGYYYFKLKENNFGRTKAIYSYLSQLVSGIWWELSFISIFSDMIFVFIQSNYSLCALNLKDISVVLKKEFNTQNYFCFVLNQWMQLVKRRWQQTE